jgi:para-nitrobenzyl esterase
VRTTRGMVRGYDDRWLGVPFARPPVGPLRWRPPQPLEHWAGEWDATAFAAPPPQPRNALSDFAWGEMPDGSEDCLYLNVWRPMSGEGGWPVLVFLLGGGFLTGWTGADVADGARLAEQAQVVVVTCAYRLGSLGWAFGNWGLRDQLAVLEWVGSEIAAFGGDPQRVTLGGQSAGANCVLDLLVSPQSAGLFQQVIVHSAPLADAAIDPERRARWEASLDAEVGTPAPEVVRRHGELMAMPPWRGGLSGARPALEQELLPCAPIDAPGSAIDRPMMIGCTRDEATFFTRAAGADASDKEVRRVTRQRFHDPTAELAQLRAAAGGRVHTFRIEHPAPDARLGALHGIDVPLLFGTFRSSSTARRFAGDERSTREVSATMQHAWSRFLHSGDPGWPVGETRRFGTAVDEA